MWTIPKFDEETLFRKTTVKAKNMEVGDFFEGVRIIEIKRTAKGNVSFKLLGGDWHRRPGEERICIRRLIVGFDPASE